MKQMEELELTEKDAKDVANALIKMLEVNGSKKALTVHFQYEDEIDSYFSNSRSST